MQTFSQVLRARSLDASPPRGRHPLVACRAIKAHLHVRPCAALLVAARRPRHSFDYAPTPASGLQLPALISNTVKHQFTAITQNYVRVSQFCRHIVPELLL